MSQAAAVVETKDTTATPAPQPAAASTTPPAPAQGTLAGQQEPAAAPALEAGKDDAGKIDYNRLIDDDTYADQVAQRQDTAPAPADQVTAGQPPADGGAGQQEQQRRRAQAETWDIEIEYDGKPERIPAEKAKMRLQEHRHLKTIYEPIARVLRSNPVLAQAVQEAARGDESAVKRLVNALRPAPVQDDGAEGEEVPPTNQKLVDAMARDPRFRGYSRKDLETIVAAQEIRDQVAAQEQNQISEQEQAERAIASRAFVQALRTGEGEVFDQVKPHMTAILEEERRDNPKEFDRVVRALNDPNVVDAEGRPAFYHLYQAAKKRLQGATAPAAAAGSQAPARPAAITATLEPGTAQFTGGAAGTSQRVDVSRMSLADRQAYFNRLIDGDG